MRVFKQRPIPFKYNLRSLMVRKGSSVLTVTSIALTVVVYMVMAGLANGLTQMYASTGRDDALIALSRGASSAEMSRLSQETLFLLKYNPAVRYRVDGTPLFSEEVYAVKPLMPPRGTQSPRWIPIRGIHPAHLDLYPDIKLIEGRALQGPQELMLGKLALNKLGQLKVGDEIPIGRQRHRVVGIFSASGTAYESELWVPNEDLKLDYQITYQSIAVFPLKEGLSAQTVARDLEDDPRLQVDIKTEKQYFVEMAESYAFIKIIGNIIAIIMSIGALFAGMNTMYTSVMSRIREIGTLRSMGFSRVSIQLAFILESLVLATLAGGLGLLTALLFNGMSLSFMRSSFHIQITLGIALEGMILALIVGFVGGFFPARHAASMKIVDVMNV